MLLLHRVETITQPVYTRRVSEIRSLHIGQVFLLIAAQEEHITKCLQGSSSTSTGRSKQIRHSKQDVARTHSCCSGGDRRARFGAGRFGDTSSLINTSPSRSRTYFWNSSITALGLSRLAHQTAYQKHAPCPPPTTPYGKLQDGLPADARFAYLFAALC